MKHEIYDALEKSIAYIRFTRKKNELLKRLNAKESPIYSTAPAVDGCTAGTERKTHSMLRVDCKSQLQLSSAEKSGMNSFRLR